MMVIRKATVEDIPLINKLAWEVFPATYQSILTREQIEYMMEWMYSYENLRRQMENEGHVYFLACDADEALGYVSVRQETDDLFHLEKIYIKGIKELHPEPCRMELNVNRQNPALGFYEHMGMEKVREGDFPIGAGFYMNDYIMGMNL